MKGSEHADAALDRVLVQRPWIVEDMKRAGNGRYARVFEYRKNVSLQVLYTPAKAGKVESIEVGLAFDDPKRAVNTSNLEDYREQLGDNESKLGLKQRDGDKGVYYYLTRTYPLIPNTPAAYDQATELCLAILDLVLGGPQVQKNFRHGRDEHAKKTGAT